MTPDTFAEQCEQDWKRILKTLLPFYRPTSVEWTDQKDILKVLQVIGAYGRSNHLFFADGSGVGLEGAKKANESGCIELDCSLKYVIKIEKIQFYHFEGNEIWDYFRIEAGDLEPTGVYERVELSEELTELTPAEYVHRSGWGSGKFQGYPLHNGARAVIRLLGGIFVIFRKDSIYNQDPGTYDARHNSMTADEFHAYIKQSL
jgi:serine/threonine-protein kinase